MGKQCLVPDQADTAHNLGKCASAFEPVLTGRCDDRDRGETCGAVNLFGQTMAPAPSSEGYARSMLV